MKVRVIQLLNNFYKDELSKEQGNDAMGTYCALGYFDAIEIRNIKIDPNNQVGVLRNISNDSLSQYNGKCNLRNIICVFRQGQDDKCNKDELFWQKAQEYPYIAITMLRVEHQGSDEEEKLHHKMEEINKNTSAIAYYSYTHSEVIVVNYGHNYGTCRKKILQIKKSFNAFKTFSILGIQEEDLKSCNRIEDEIVNICLSAVVKDLEKARKYTEDLCEYLRTIIGEGDSNFGFEAYDTLGERDLIIKIWNINLKKFLKCYRMGEILTHSNLKYHEAFFNIETEIVTPFYTFRG